MSSQLDEETLFKNRLAIDERAVKRCLKRFQTFVKAVKSPRSQDNWEQLYDLFKLDLAQTELSLSCQEMVSISLQQEYQSCEDDLEQIDLQLEAIEAAIACSKQVLARERKANAQKIEYNSIIKKIQEYSSRAVLEASIAEAKASIEALEREREIQHKCAMITKTSLQEILDQVQKFQTLVSAIESSPSAAIETFTKASPISSTSTIPEEIHDSSPASDSDCEIVQAPPHKSSSISIDCSPSDSHDESILREKSQTERPASPRKRKMDSPSVEEGEWTPRSPHKRPHLSE
ncbi:hypothetical protein L0F63_001141 [Massospora cicadina]|nr:hypothetical protein L0F63_001141 [Massospora cicadina]